MHPRFDRKGDFGLLLCARQREEKCRTPVWFALGPGASAVPDDDAAYGGQPDAGAFELIGARRSWDTE